MHTRTRRHGKVLLSYLIGFNNDLRVGHRDEHGGAVDQGVVVVVGILHQFHHKVVVCRIEVIAQAHHGPLHAVHQEVALQVAGWSMHIRYQGTA